MKSRKIINLCLTSLCLTSCTFFAYAKSPTYHFDIAYIDVNFDKDKLDSYFLSNSDIYPTYQELKNNQPNLLDHIKVIRSTNNHRLGHPFLLRFSLNNNGFLDNQTFLMDQRSDGDYYFKLGQAFGGFGVTDFVVRRGYQGDWIFFLYSFGSGIHQTNIGAYDINSFQLYSFDGVELPNNQDFMLVVDKKRNVDVYTATITASYDDEGFPTFNIVKGELQIDNIDDYNKTKI